MHPICNSVITLLGEMGVFADDLHYKNIIKICEDRSSLESHLRSTLTIICVCCSIRAWPNYGACSTSKVLKKPTPFLLENLWFQAKVAEIELVKRWRRAEIMFNDMNPVGYWRFCLKNLLDMEKLWTGLQPWAPTFRKILSVLHWRET